MSTLSNMLTYIMSSPTPLTRWLANFFQLSSPSSSQNTNISPFSPFSHFDSVPVHQFLSHSASSSSSPTSSTPAISFPAVSTSNISSAGNTYKNLYEATSMHSGLFLIFVVNIITVILAILFYRYVILRDVPLLSPEDIRLLKKYPSFSSCRPHNYTPHASLARAAPPMRWTNWRDFFTSTETPLSRDAQVYLLFQRVCIVITTLCAILSSLTLLPAYWFGFASVTTVDSTNTSPRTLLSLLKSDRGTFERLTSHNLPSDSPLFLLQLPVFAIVSVCVVGLYAVVNVAAGGTRSIEDWLRSGPSTSPSAVLPSSSRQQPSSIASTSSTPSSSLVRQQSQSQSQSQSQPHSQQRFKKDAQHRVTSSSTSRAKRWTVFARGLPKDIPSADNLYELLDAIFRYQVDRVELVCQGKISEARLQRNLSTALHRLEYLYSCAESNNENLSFRPSSQSMLGKILCLFRRRRTRAEMIRELQLKIDNLQRELQSRKAQPVRDFRGCAFITFHTSEAAAFALFNFPMRIRRIVGTSDDSGHSNNTRNITNNPIINTNTNNNNNNNTSNMIDNHDETIQDDNLNNNGSNDGTSSTTTTTISRSRDSIFGEHSRTVSELDVPYFRNLCKGTANLLPLHLRNRLMPSPTNALLQQLDNSGAESGTDDNASNRSTTGSTTATSTMSETQRREYAITRLRNMKAERAPKSGDVIWSNLGMSFLERSVREMVVQVMVFAVLILFTSPVTMLTAMKLVFSEVSLLADPQLIFGNNSTASTSSTPFASSSHPHHSGINLTDSMGLSFLTNITADSGAAVESLSQDLLKVLPSFLTSNTYLTTAILAYFPVLLLAFIFAIVPSLLRFTCALEGYPTRSAMEMSVFRKTSFYYVMNAVVLPSLALNTASEFLGMLYKQSGGGVNVTDALPIFQRLFSGDIAYFLCTYLVQLALTGSVFWLMRIPSTISMMIRRRLAVTPLEAAEAKCAGIFDYPRHYAYCVTVMSMVLLFGMMAPLIWYFALFYFMCKHCVDVYTLRYVHPRTHIDGRLPRLSANFILTWTIVSQISLAIIFYLQRWIRAAILTCILCVATLIACLSAPSSVGNRMLSVIAVMRDAALDRMLRLFGGFYTQLDQVAGLSTNSSSSSSGVTSASSIADMRESNALLMHVYEQRELGPVSQEESHISEQAERKLHAKYSMDMRRFHGIDSLGLEQKQSGEMQTDANIQAQSVTTNGDNTVMKLDETSEQGRKNMEGDVITKQAKDVVGGFVNGYESDEEDEENDGLFDEDVNQRVVVDDEDDDIDIERGKGSGDVDREEVERRHARGYGTCERREHGGSAGARNFVGRQLFDCD